MQMFTTKSDASEPSIASQVRIPRKAALLTSAETSLSSIIHLLSVD